MSGINWHNLQLTLLRGGVAPKYVRRTIKELQQHHSDLVQELLNSGLNHDEALIKANHEIGTEQTIAREVLTKQELMSWAHRFPKLILLAAPVVGYPILFLVLFFGTVTLPIELIFGGNGGQTQNPQGWPLTFIYSALFFYSYLLTPLFLIGLSIFARNRTTQILWPLLAVIIIAFLGSGLTSSLIVSSEPGQSSLGLTWGYNFLGIPVSGNATTWSVLRMVGTIAICGAFLYFYRPLEEKTVNVAA